MAESCPEHFIAFAESLAEAVRPQIRQAFRSGLDVVEKADESPVTQADRGAEATLRGLIEEAYPAHGIVGEEYGTEREDAEYVWVLDPIDGTKAFITGNPLFGTLIALLHRGGPVLGVIEMPALEERWVGALGHPTRFHDREGTQSAKTRDTASLDDAILTATSPHMFKGPEEAAFARLQTSCKLALYGGDCFCYGKLASGFTDLVVESSMQPYDYLAHVPVIAGAGGIITDWEGRPLGLESGGRVVAGGGAEIHKAALDLLQHG